MVFCCAHQATVARFVGQTSSAVRPLGKLMCAVSTHSGAPLLTRFWKKASAPRASARVATLAPACTPSCHRSRVTGRSRSARMMPSPTAT